VFMVFIQLPPNAFSIRTSSRIVAGESATLDKPMWQRHENIPHAREEFSAIFCFLGVISARNLVIRSFCDW